MTLVLAVGISKNMVVMTTDKRRVTQGYYYYLTTGRYEKVEGRRPEVSEGEHVKSFKVSNYSLIGIGGISELGSYIKDEMLEICMPDDDILACKEKLENVIEDARREIGHGERFLQFLNQDDGLMIVLVGFLKDGTVGHVSFKSGEGSKVGYFTSTSEDDHLYAMIPPVEKYSAFVGDLFEISELTPEFWDDEGHLGFREDKEPYKKAQRDVLASKMEWIHALISYNHPDLISSDGVRHILKFNSENNVEHSTEEYETKYKQELIIKPLGES